MKKKVLHKSLLFCLLAIFFVISGRAQSNKSSTQILQHYIEQSKKLMPYEENVRFLEQKKQSLPLLSEISLRTESDEFKLEKQRYQARFKFNTRKERVLNNTLAENKKGAYKIRQDAFLLKQLKDVYRSLVDYYFTQEQINYQEEELLILEDKKDIYQKLMEQAQSFDAEKWLKNEENILEIKTKLIKNKSWKAELANRILLNQKDKEELVISDWLSIENLQNFIRDTLVTRNLPPTLLTNQMKENEANIEYQLEQSKANQWLDFVQMEYKGNKKLPYNKEVSFGAGIKLPFRAFGRKKVNRAYLACIETENKTRQEESKFHKAMERSLSSIERLLVEYKLFENYIKTQNIKETYQSYLKSTAVSPILLLNIKQILISQQKTKLSLQKEIFNKYVNLLIESGTLIKKPLKNYLTNGFDLIP